MVRMIKGTEELLRMNFVPSNIETLETDCQILLFLSLHYRVSAHPFSILAKSALLTTDTVATKLSHQHRQKLHSFLFNYAAAPSRLPKQQCIRQLMAELRGTPPCSPQPRALASPITKRVTPLAPAAHPSKMSPPRQFEDDRDLVHRPRSDSASPEDACAHLRARGSMQPSLRAHVS